jgi:tetratricopeptide (TPR) repeat protein
LTAAIERAAALLAANPAAARAQAQAVLARSPDDPRAMLILGSALRREGDAAGARARLEPLARAWPRAANTHYELGLTLAALGEPQAAIVALRHAVTLQRDLAVAWRALGDLLFQQGDAAGAVRAFAEHDRAIVRDPALRPAAEALFEGRLDEAERLLRARLPAAPGDAAALRMLSDAMARQGRDHEAEALLVQCLELNPAYHGARFTYANVLFRLQKWAEALAQVDRLLATDATDPAYRNLAAACLGLVGDHERAIEIYESLLTQYSSHPQIWLNYGHALRTIGRREHTVAAYRRCLALAPGFGEAYWSLANLKTVSFSAEDRASMAAQLEREDLGGEDRLHLHYALGKSLEDGGDYGASVEHYRSGAELRRVEAPYGAEETTERVRRSIALFTKDFFDARAGAGSPSSEPIFIVGLPRAGSTLVEQILASHSAVEGTQELPDIGYIAGRLEQEGEGGYPELLASINPGRFAGLGEAYLERTRVHRRLGRRSFVDKMPNNFFHLGLIHLILPGARVIDVRRHPLGSCFSAYKQHFAQGHAFSYDLADVGRYYRDYVTLMAHFDDVLPGRVHRVIYEDLVEDTEGEVRRLLDYCQLPFEASCLKFYDNDRAVRTVSSEQVRRPIFRDGLDRWRSFEAWLGPLKEALAPVLETWRGAPAGPTTWSAAKTLGRERQAQPRGDVA